MIHVWVWFGGKPVRVTARFKRKSVLYREWRPFGGFGQTMFERVTVFRAGRYVVMKTVSGIRKAKAEFYSRRTFEEWRPEWGKMKTGKGARWVPTPMWRTV